MRVNTEGGDKIITYIGSVAFMWASLLKKIFKFSDYYQAMAEDPRPTAWSRGTPGFVGDSRFCWVGNDLTWHVPFLKVIQFHWPFWVVSLPGTSIGI